MRKFKTLLVTGGCGFIGCNFIRYMLNEYLFEGKIINIDALTYSGHRDSLTDIEQQYPTEKYQFIQADIRDYPQLEAVFNEHCPDGIVHFAAETHVDRSIHGPADFISTNINGTFNLLELSRKFSTREELHFHHISTDEVFGSLGAAGKFCETTPYDPRSPYSASKASSDHLVRAYRHTYGLSSTISSCSNNYGPYQFPEKLIPLMIRNILDGKELPVYGDGKNIRDWLHVKDHCSAVWKILQQGKSGETYNIGGESELGNISLVHTLCEETAKLQGLDRDAHKKLISFVADRPGHDRRYAIDCSKMKRELNWRPATDFRDGLRSTIRWYMDNSHWCEAVQSHDYHSWIEKNYADRKQQQQDGET